MWPYPVPIRFIDNAVREADTRPDSAEPPMGSQKRRRQQTAGGGGKMTAVSPPPKRVLLGRVYFMNNEQSKYVSVGVSSCSQLQPCVEFGAPRRMPVVLTSYYLSTLSQHLPKLCQNMCNNQIYTCKKLLFRLQASGSGSVAKVIYNKQSISLRLNDSDVRHPRCVSTILRSLVY